jgi:phosphomannomutase
MKSTSGIRGIVGQSLDPLVVARYAAAFGKFLKGGKVVVGRDSRPSGAGFSQIVVSTLAMSGCDVIDLGIVPTPTVELAVLHHKAAGGIAITASHNPAEWNALKFFNSLGEFITAKQYAQLEKIAAGEIWNFMPFDRHGKTAIDDKAVERHIKSALGLSVAARKEIKASRFTVVVDAINGAGSQALPEILERLGAKVIRLNCKGDGDFFRKPEPVVENLVELGESVKKHHADLGLACDPDADRLALVDENGRPVGEEMTLTLSVAYYLTQKRGPIAINLSTSRMTADVAHMAGSRVYYSPVGEANVIDEMRRCKAVIGGEGNGGVILPESHYGRDALVGAVLILSYLAKSKKRLSTLAGTIPAYANIKKKAPLPKDFERKVLGLEKSMQSDFGKVSVDRRDGLRFDLDDGWVQVRKSNTEPIYRLIAEAKTEKLVRRLVSLVTGKLK